MTAINGRVLSMLKEIVPSASPFAGMNWTPWVERYGLSAHFAALTPKFDLSQFSPRVDFSGLAGFSGLRDLVERLVREHQPPNWPFGLSLDRATEIIHEDGIPLVWVPREAIVRELLDAEDREARVRILVSHEEAIADDCDQVLDDIHHEALDGLLPLGRCAVRALRSGHHEAAMATAVTITDTLLKATMRPKKKYKEMREAVHFDPRSDPISLLRLTAAFGPIYRFLYDGWGSDEEQLRTLQGDALNRHVSVHFAHIEHYTKENSLISVMLATSMLRAVQDLPDSQASTA